MALITRQMQIKTTLRCHLMALKDVIIEKTIASADKDVEKKAPLYTAGGNAN